MGQAFRRSPKENIITFRSPGRRISTAFAAALCLLTTSCGSSSSGSLTFGTVLQGYSLRHTRSTFTTADTLAWVAQFASQADPGTITATILQRDAACPSGRALTSVQLPLQDVNGKQEAYQIPVMNFPVSGVPIPGSYTLDLSQHSALLATGHFTLTGSAAGTITFGHGYSRRPGGGFTVNTPATRFHASDQIAWVARFSEPAGGRTVSVAFDRVRGCAAIRVLRDDHVRLGTASATSFATRLPIADLVTLGVKDPGTYIVSYTHGSHFLARGEVTLSR